MDVSESVGLFISGLNTWDGIVECFLEINLWDMGESSWV